MHITKPTMTEEAAKFWTCVFSAITAIGLVGGGLYTLTQYFDAREKDSKTFEFQARVAQIEAQKQYYSKVMDMCVDVSTVTSTIATSPDNAKRRQALNDFKRFLYGPAQIIENDELRQSMMEFEKCLQTDCGTAGRPDEKNELLSLSGNVANSCAHEIIHGLNVGRMTEPPTALGATSQ